jgi:cell wall-associated NlpC family hydrolase
MLIVPAAASADPDTVASVTAQLKTLAIQNEQLTEQFNAAQIDVDAKAAAATAAQAAAATAAATYSTARTQFNGTIVEQYTGSTFSRTAALLESESGQAYLDTLQTLNMLNNRRASAISALTASKSAADQAQTAAQTLLTQATAQRDALATQKTDLDAQQTKYKSELASLTAAQQAAYITAQSTAITPTGQVVAPPAADVTVDVPAPSAAAAIAVQTAMAQRGKPYVYAAGGPNAFDCSGLTAYAWAAAGVSLPHNAAAQYGYGTHVSLDQLQPGDLVFYYSPIGHVAMYIGDGLVVHAPTEGEDVRVVSTYASGTPVGATRLT